MMVLPPPPSVASFQPQHHATTTPTDALAFGASVNFCCGVHGNKIATEAGGPSRYYY